MINSCSVHMFVTLTLIRVGPYSYYCETNLPSLYYVLTRLISSQGDSYAKQKMTAISYLFKPSLNAVLINFVKFCKADGGPRSEMYCFLTNENYV